MIEIYTKSGCASCDKAKTILNSLNVNYKTYVVEQDLTREELMDKFPFAKSYPIVIINGKFIGGYTELEQRIFEERENIGKTLLTE
jgi:glutaredoxin